MIELATKITFVWIAIAGNTHGFSPEEEMAIAQAVVMQSARTGLDASLLLGVIQVESSFKKHQVSRVGAMGLMQVRPTTAVAFAAEAGVEWDGAETLFDIHSNIAIGATYLAFKLRRFGSVELALTAYCHGPTRLRRVLREGEVSASMLRYANKVQLAMFGFSFVDHYQ
jgi:soluble lytic murein transglycosylase-like protein